MNAKIVFLITFLTLGLASAHAAEPMKGDGMNKSDSMGMKDAGDKMKDDAMKDTSDGKMKSKTAMKGKKKNMKDETMMKDSGKGKMMEEGGAK